MVCSTGRSLGRDAALHVHHQLAHGASCKAFARHTFVTGKAYAQPAVQLACLDAAHTYTQHPPREGAGGVGFGDPLFELEALGWGCCVADACDQGTHFCHVLGPVSEPDSAFVL